MINIIKVGSIYTLDDLIFLQSIDRVVSIINKITLQWIYIKLQPITKMNQGNIDVYRNALKQLKEQNIKYIIGIDQYLFIQSFFYLNYY